MRRKVALARRLQRIDKAMAANGLQRLAGLRFRIAVIDDHERSAFGRDSLRERAHDLTRFWADLDPAASRRRKRGAARGNRLEPPVQFPIVIKSAKPLAPTLIRSHEVLHRQ